METAGSRGANADAEMGSDMPIAAFAGSRAAYVGAYAAVPYPHASHPPNTLGVAPVISLAELLAGGTVQETALADLRGYDHLVNYLYLPAIAEAGMPESLALLFSSITIHRDYLEHLYLKLHGSRL